MMGAAIGVPAGGAMGGVGGKALDLGLGTAPRIASRFGRRGDVPEPPAGYGLDDLTNGRIAMDAEPLPSVRRRAYLDMGPARAGRLDQPMSEARIQAAASDIQPRDVLPILSNEVGSVEEAAAIGAGRIAPATAPDEHVDLSRRIVKAQNSGDIPKRGPLDLVTWLRSQGGLKEQGGELSAAYDAR